MNRNYQDLPKEFKEMLPIIFSSATEAILVVDRSGEILMVNPGATRLFEYGENELEGMSVDKLLPDALQKHHAQLRESYYEKPHARPMGVGLDLEGMKKDGSRFAIEVSLNHMQFEGKMYVVAFIVDVTAQRHYQKQLKEYSSQMEKMVKERTTELEQQVIETQKAEKIAQQSVETYKMIARNFPHGTINVFDRDLRYLFVEGKELFEMGITSEELFGSKYTERLAPEIAQLAESNLQKVFEGEAISFEIEQQGNYYKINAVPLLTDEQGVSQILVVEQNITNNKLAEQEIEKALEKEQKLGQLKSKFVTLASHEFRTPLATISSSASLIARYQTTEQQPKRDKHIARIQSNIKHLTNILNDFLSLGKLEEGKIQSEPCHFDLAELCQELIEELSPLLKDGQQISCVQSGTESTVFLDKKLLHGGLVILLSNAIKYSDENQLIHISLHLNSLETKIAIKDEGIGIPEEDQSALFSRFYRASNTGNIQGTGMGLNILKKYVDLMEGEINLESEKGNGTTVTLTFQNTIG